MSHKTALGIARRVLTALDDMVDVVARRNGWSRAEVLDRMLRERLTIWLITKQCAPRALRARTFTLVIVLVRVAVLVDAPLSTVFTQLRQKLADAAASANPASANDVDIRGLVAALPRWI